MNFFKKAINKLTKRAEKGKRASDGAIYFGKVKMKKANTNETKRHYYNVEQEVDGHDRILLPMLYSKLLLNFIDGHQFRDSMFPIEDNLANSCEILHYACVHNIPVRVEHVSRVVPNLDISHIPIIDANNYQDCVKFCEDFDTFSEEEIEQMFEEFVENQEARTYRDDKSVNQGGATSEKYKKGF